VSETILLPVDGSEGANKAVELVAGYRGERGAIAISVLNVQEPPALAWPELAAYLQPIESELQAGGQAVVDRALPALRAAGLRVDASVRLGFPAEAILREAESKSATLIVMGTRGHGLLQGFAFGSVAMRVAHGSPIPVWLLHPQCKLPKEFGRKLRVLLAVDGAAPSIAAARRLASWQGWLGVLDVQMVFVQRPLSLAETLLPPHDDVVEQWSTRAAEAATVEARQILAKAGVAHHLHITVGDPAQEIAHLAGHTGAELVAVGTRGRGAAHHALIGSVALKTAARADVPVMLVR
jgi:nucleotide-binding universal stress UspA family protein